MHRSMAVAVLVLCACEQTASPPPSPAPAPPSAAAPATPAPSAAASAPGVIVATSSHAGAVQGTAENSDAFLWRLFTEFVAPVTPGKSSPVLFETWASDKDTFSLNPKWPSPKEPFRLRASVLATAKFGGPRQGLLGAHLATTIDEKCKPPPGAAAGGFPIEPVNDAGVPLPCIAEQVARNREEFDYIVNNHLNTQKGLAAAFADGGTVEMPTPAIGVKGDWVPVRWLPVWIPQLGDAAAVRHAYFTATVDGEEYALVSMHVSSRQNPNWVWGTFEHQMNPGRCDDVGCDDSFGAEIPLVRPNREAANTQYGPCRKTPALEALMEKAGDDPVWKNYCLKATQVDYVSADGVPYALGNSVIEGIVGNGTVAASSCITCHAYASFGSNGAPTAAATAILPFNPTGRPIATVLVGSKTFAFNWGVLLAP